MLTYYGLSYSQTTGFFRYDTVAFQKIGGNSEFNLYNATRGVTGGVLTNIGGGRTAFITPTGGSNTSLGSGVPLFINGTQFKSLTFGSGITYDTTTSGQIRLKLGGDMNSGVSTITGTGTSSASNTINFNAVKFSVKFNTSSSEIPHINANNLYVDIGDGNINYSYTRWVDGFIYNRSKDSIQLAVGDTLTGSSATSYLNIYPFHQDQFAPDSLVWRISNRSAFYFLGNKFSHLYADSAMKFESENGLYQYTDLLATTDTTNFKPGGYDASGNLKRLSYWPGGGGSTPLSSITAATGTNTINNVSHAQEWQWNSLTTQKALKLSSSSITNGYLLYLEATGTAQVSNGATFGISMSGANGSSTQLTRGILVTNTRTGSVSTNRGIELNVSGGSLANDAIYVTAGNVNIQPLTASQLVGTDASKNLVSVSTITNTRWTARVGSTTSSTTPTINTDATDIYKLTAQAADITSMTTNLSGTPVDGDILEIQITGTAARAITWGTSFVSSTVTLPTTTVTTATLTVIFQYYTTSSYGNNKWVCVNYY